MFADTEADIYVMVDGDGTYDPGSLKKMIDLLSDYRVMSRRLVKSFPAISSGFEIETELTIHALSLNLPMVEVDTPYKERPDESASKLSTYRDGVRILSTILMLTKEERPFFFFTALAALFTLFSLMLGVPVTLDFLKPGWSSDSQRPYWPQVACSSPS